MSRLLWKEIAKIETDVQKISKYRRCCTVFRRTYRKITSVLMTLLTESSYKQGSFYFHDLGVYSEVWFLFVPLFHSFLNLIIFSLSLPSRPRIKSVTIETESTQEVSMFGGQIQMKWHTQSSPLTKLPKVFNSRNARKGLFVSTRLPSTNYWTHCDKIQSWGSTLKVVSRT